MKFGMNMLLWTGDVTDAHFPILAKIKQWGFDAAEIALFNTSAEQVKRTRRELDSLGLACTTGHIATAETNPISEDASIRSAALNSLKRTIDYTVDLGGSLVMGPFHSALGRMVGRGRTDQEWGWCKEYLRAASEHAGQAGVKLSVEPLNRFECYFLNTNADANRIVAEVDHPALGYLYDSFHSNIEERDIYTGITENAVGINHIHISENHRGVPGQGHVHWADTFRGIKAIGYDGYLTIEAFGRALPELAAATCIWRDLFDSEEQVATEGLAFIKKMLG